MIRYEVRRKIILTNGEVFDIHHRTYHEKKFADERLALLKEDAADPSTLYIKETGYDCSAG